MITLSPIPVPDWSVVVFIVAFVAIPFIISSSTRSMDIGSMESVRSTFGDINNSNNSNNGAGLLPPGWVFAMVWTILYAAMGLSMWFALKTPPSGSNGPAYGTWVAALALFSVGAALNWAWVPVFSGGDSRDALWVLLAALASTATAAALFVETSVPAAACLVPLLVWYAYALMLNARVVENKTK